MNAFNFAMIALNKRLGLTSRFYVNGSGFADPMTVFINGKPCDRTTVVDPTLLSVAVKFGTIMPFLKVVAGATGEIPITITVADTTGKAQEKIVTVLVVDEGDVP